MEKNSYIALVFNFLKKNNMIKRNRKYMKYVELMEVGEKHDFKFNKTALKKAENVIRSQVSKLYLQEEHFGKKWYTMIISDELIIRVIRLR